MKVSKSFLILVAVLLLSGITGCSKKTAASQKNVKIAIQPSAAFIPLYLVRYSGELDEELSKSGIEVVWQDFESGPPMVDSLGADLSDIAVLGDVPTVLALANPTKMKLVGIPARGPNAYAVLSWKNNKSVNSFADLKGKKVATVFGSTGHNFVKKLLEKYNFSFSDIELLNISASTVEETLAFGVADAVVIWEPNVTRLVDRGGAKIIAQGDETNLRGTNGLVVRSEFLHENEDVISCLMKHYSKAVETLDSMSPEMASKIAAVLKITPDQLFRIIKKYDFSMEIQSEDVKSLQDTISFLVSIKNLPSEYRLEDFVRNDFFDEN